MSALRAIESIWALLRDPGVRRVMALAVIAFVLVVLRSPGSIGLDAQLRMASARWLWAGTSPDTVTDIPAEQLDLFLLEGRDGRPHVWFGVGQQLLLAPADVALNAVLSLVPGLSSGAARQLHRVGLALVFFPMLMASAAVAVFALLRTLGFAPRVAFWAVVLVLAGSPVVRHAAEGMETAEEVAWLALALTFLVRYLRRPSWSTAAGLVVAPAMMVLLRLPHLAVFGGLAVWVVVSEAGSTGRSEGSPTRWPLRRLGGVAALLALALVIAIAGDRAFQWWRFGELTSTYSHAAEARWGEFFDQPVEFFGGGLLAGVWNQLAGAGKALPLYHPLSMLVPVFVWWWGRRTAADVVEGRARALDRGATWVAGGSLVGVYVVFYARYFFTFDTQSWGNRYVEAPLVVMLAVMLAALIERWQALALALRVVVVVVVAWSVATMTMAGASTFRDEVALGSRAMPARLDLGLPPFDYDECYGDFSFGRRAIIAGRFVAGLEATPADDVAFAPAYLPFQFAARIDPREDPITASLATKAIGGWHLAWGLLILALAMLARRDALRGTDAGSTEAPS